MKFDWYVYASFQLEHEVLIPNLSLVTTQRLAWPQPITLNLVTTTNDDAHIIIWEINADYNLQVSYMDIMSNLTITPNFQLGKNALLGHNSSSELNHNASGRNSFLSESAWNESGSQWELKHLYASLLTKLSPFCYYELSFSIRVRKQLHVSFSAQKLHVV